MKSLFIRNSRCSGTLVVKRFSADRFGLGKSNSCRKSSSLYRLTLPYTVRRANDGVNGDEGPPVFRSSAPETNRSESRTCSAVMRRRSTRQYSRSAASFSKFLAS